MATLTCTRTAECACPRCLNADLDAHILATRGAAALARINGSMRNVAQATEVRTPGNGNGSARKSTSTVRMATPKQLEWLVKLTDREVTGEVAATRASAIAGEAVTLKAASAALDVLFKAPRIRVTLAKPTESVATGAALSIGIYLYDGAYYRVKQAKAGHLYAMMLDRSAGDAWVMAWGTINQLDPATKLTLAECEALSLALGECCMCGRTLSATVNGVGPGARFVGPVCEGRMGF